VKEPTLLDVFAVFAMHAMLQRGHEIELIELSEVSYEIAQAMLEQSQKAEHGQPH
jgi:hypothetical protein